MFFLFSFYFFRRKTINHFFLFLSQSKKYDLTDFWFSDGSAPMETPDLTLPDAVDSTDDLVPTLQVKMNFKNFKTQIKAIN